MFIGADFQDEAIQEEPRQKQPHSLLTPVRSADIKRIVHRAACIRFEGCSSFVHVAPQLLTRVVAKSALSVRPEGGCEMEIGAHETVIKKFGAHIPEYYKTLIK